MPDQTTYYLRRLDVFDDRIVPVAEPQLTAVRAANDTLLVALGIEEKLEFVVANYVEYESELLRLSLHEIVWSNHDWSIYRNAKHIVNRRLVNLLSTARLYLDQVVHDIGTIAGPTSSARESIKEAAAHEYDTHREYRAMEALRNYVQHRDVPVQALSFPALIDADTDPITRRQSASPLLDVRRLESDRQFKPAVLKELQTIGDAIPLTPFVRKYVASITRVHAVVRRAIARPVAEAEARLTELCALARETFGDNLSQVVLTVEKEGQPAVTNYLVSQVANELHSLRSKNQKLDGLEYSFVCSEPPETTARRAQTG